MFRPRDSYDQRLIEASIAITPEPASLHWVHDVFGNCVAVARFADRAKELRFECRIRLDHTPVNALEFQLEDHARWYPFTYSAEDLRDLSSSVERQYVDPNREIDGWVRRFLNESGRTDTLSQSRAAARQRTPMKLGPDRPPGLHSSWAGSPDARPGSRCARGRHDCSSLGPPPPISAARASVPGAGWLAAVHGLGPAPE